jgi:hypothetical protein
MAESQHAIETDDQVDRQDGDAHDQGPVHFSNFEWL